VSTARARGSRCQWRGPVVVVKASEEANTAAPSRIQHHRKARLAPGGALPQMEDVLSQVKFENSSRTNTSGKAAKRHSRRRRAALA
jgi:hypothetical protein